MTGGSRLAAALAAAAILLAGCGGEPGTKQEPAHAASGKPVVPAEAALETVGAFSPGDPARFRLTVKPLMDAPDASITFLLPKGATVSEGEASWKGALKSNEERAWELTVTVPGANGYAVTADVVLVESGGTRLMKRVSAGVGAPAKAAASVSGGHKHTGVSKSEYLKKH